MILAAALMLSPARSEPVIDASAPAVTILKPLHGDEVGPVRKSRVGLRTGLPGPVQIVFGVESPNDPAIAVVERLRAAYPGTPIELVVDTRVMGSNPKIANLINMSERIAHDIVVVADSDIRVQRDYLSRLVRALERFGGAVTCPYYGISTGNPVVAPGADDHRQSFSPGRRGRRAAEAFAAVPGLDHRAAPAIARRHRRLRAARRLPGRRLCAGRIPAGARRAGDGAAVRGRPCVQRIVVCSNCGGTSCAGR